MLVSSSRNLFRNLAKWGYSNCNDKTKQKNKKKGKNSTIVFLRFFFCVSRIIFQKKQWSQQIREIYHKSRILRCFACQIGKTPWPAFLNKISWNIPQNHVDFHIYFDSRNLSSWAPDALLSILNFMTILVKEYRCGRKGKISGGPSIWRTI